ncbi:MAG: DUF6273 domain-containing protein, partial [Halanaerobiales bacterium]
NFYFNGEELEIGDYLAFGNYNGRPIVWRVIDIKDDCPLLLSSDIITIKPFDAPESGMAGRTVNGRSFDSGESYSAIELREMWGSNFWTNSNLREWLNSEEEVVNYTTYPPAAAALYYQSNSYDKESGFLTNFSQSDLELIKPVEHRVLLTELDLIHKEGGYSLYEFNNIAKLNQAIANYDQSFFMNVTDHVFLLSVNELKDYLWDRGWDIRSSLTDQALARDEFDNAKYIIEDTEGYYMWWLRTPAAHSSYQLCVVDYNGNIKPMDVDNIQYGVRPALYLHSRRYSMQGNGSKDDPYIIK